MTLDGVSCVKHAIRPESDGFRPTRSRTEIASYKYAILKLRNKSFKSEFLVAKDCTP